MNLFTEPQPASQGEPEKMAPQQDEPLASRMRPLSLEEFVGQQHLLGEDGFLHHSLALENQGQPGLGNMVLWGPPGSGKTTLALLLAKETGRAFLRLSAVLDGLKELRSCLQQAEQLRRTGSNQADGKTVSGPFRAPILFVDEIHRWNKSQQDALLPWVEQGTVLLVGATTENPAFELNNALLSRVRVLELAGLEPEDLGSIISRALQDSARGVGQSKLQLQDDAKQYLLEHCGGDARRLLNALELLAQSTRETNLNRQQVRTFLQRQNLYDRSGDYHYDTISAFIKSVRGSDADSALYWLQLMLQGGETPRFIWRRLLILAAEDIGLADPQALVQVQAAAQAFEWVGLPEGEYFLSQATIYLALAPKSNSVGAFWQAKELLRRYGPLPVPPYLRGHAKNQAKQDSARNTVRPDKQEPVHGYLYPHNYNGHWIEQTYSDEKLPGHIYRPGAEGWERERGMEHLRRLDMLREAQNLEKIRPVDAPANPRRDKNVAMIEETAPQRSTAYYENRHEVLLSWNRLRLELVQFAIDQDWDLLDILAFEAQPGNLTDEPVPVSAAAVTGRPVQPPPEAMPDFRPFRQTNQRWLQPSADFLYREWQHHRKRQHGHGWRESISRNPAVLLHQIWNLSALLQEFCALPELSEGVEPPEPESRFIQDAGLWQDRSRVIEQCEQWAGRNSDTDYLNTDHSKPEYNAPKIYALEEYPLGQPFNSENEILQILDQVEATQNASAQDTRPNLPALAEFRTLWGQHLEMLQRDQAHHKTQCEKDLLAFCHLQPVKSWNIPYRRVLHEKLWHGYTRLLPEELRPLWLNCYTQLQPNCSDAKQIADHPLRCTLQKHYCILAFS
ncbi:replication-associated recombination protein A [Candidatus Haliotispira prima]|uniref:Replication-associated recombination protein A n=1 Tax=Candidatus Haliotispira prima TaxID=3034016 RepID=A0ABY8MJ53_9SPIO|nr:replication-associated recombination protein A [Candidatus Haliotispira prima]